MFAINARSRDRFRPWYPGRLRRLDLNATTALTRIVDAFEQSSVKVGNRIAWGQYLDKAHFSKAQWGFYGTSSGVQVAAIRARLAKEDPLTDELVRRVLQFPTDASSPAPVFSEKVEKSDLDNVVKLAAIAEALFPGWDDVPDSSTPQIVRHLMTRVAPGGTFWSSRLPRDPSRRTSDRDFPTAIVICALRRYECFRRSPLWLDTRKWLADRVLKDDWFNTPMNCALVGLALLPHPLAMGTDVPEITRALDKCRKELTGWTRDQHTIVVDRPIFNGFSIGRRNDYLFLHPELVAALLFLESGNPRATRRFVLRVLDAVCKNTLQWQGFMGQSGMISCVDQLWAVRLIARYSNGREEKEHFLPAAETYVLPVTRRGRILWGIALILAAVGISIFAGWPGVIAAVAGILLLFAGWLKS